MSNRKVSGKMKEFQFQTFALFNIIIAFLFFKVRSVTCLNNKLYQKSIQSSSTISIIFEQLFGEFMLITIIYVCYSSKLSQISQCKRMPYIKVVRKNQKIDEGFNAMIKHSR